jgi:ribosomal protein L12E/L44/L45/RPP1/RPP2
LSANNSLGPYSQAKTQVITKKKKKKKEEKEEEEEEEEEESFQLTSYPNQKCK